VGRAGRHFAGRTDRQTGNFVTELGKQPRRGVVVAQAGQFAGRLDRHAVGPHDQAVPGFAGGLAFEHQGLDPGGGEHDRPHAAGVAFFDAAGQRALGPGRQPARTWGAGAAEDARREDQLVLGRKRMAGRRDFGGDDRRGERAAAQRGVLRRDRLRPHRLVCQVDAVDRAHGGWLLILRGDGFSA
jgi:hypothetical protein